MSILVKSKGKDSKREIHTSKNEHQRHTRIYIILSIKYHLSIYLTVSTGQNERLNKVF